MASASDVVTLISSLGLRLGIWIFLRWVSSRMHSAIPPLPYHHFRSGPSTYQPYVQRIHQFSKWLGHKLVPRG